MGLELNMDQVDISHHSSPANKTKRETEGRSHTVSTSGVLSELIEPVLFLSLIIFVHYIMYAERHMKEIHIILYIIFPTYIFCCTSKALEAFTIW